MDFESDDREKALHSVTDPASALSPSSAPLEPTGGMARRPQVVSRARPLAASSVSVDPLLNPDPLIWGGAPSVAQPEDSSEAPSAPVTSPAASSVPTSATSAASTTSSAVQPSGFLDSMSRAGAWMRGDDAFSKDAGKDSDSTVNTMASAMGYASYLPEVTEAVHGVNLPALAKHTGVGMQAAAMLAKESRGEKPTDVASEARKDYVAADMQRMAIRKANKGGLLKSAVLKALAAKRLGDAVQKGGHRAAYESTMEESEQVNAERPETNAMTKAMQVAALPGQALSRTGGVMANADDGEEDFLKGNYKTAIGMSALGVANEGVKATLSTASNVALPVVGSVAATTAYKNVLGRGTQVGGKLLAAPFRALGGADQDQADAYDKQWDGGSQEEREDGTAETRAGEVLRRGFRSRGQATGPDGVGWAKSGAKEDEPEAAPAEPGAWGWLKSKFAGLWGSGKTAAKHAFHDEAVLPAQKGMAAASKGAAAAKGLFGQLGDWWSRFRGEEPRETKVADDEEGIEMQSL